MKVEDDTQASASADDTILMEEWRRMHHDAMTHSADVERVLADVRRVFGPNRTARRKEKK